MLHHEPPVCVALEAPEAEELKLADGAIAKLRDAAGTRICCVAGTLWVTQEHDPRDIIVAEGECFELDRSGLALISSLGLEHAQARAVLLRPLGEVPRRSSEHRWDVRLLTAVRRIMAL